jgi:hypothetical protein
VTPVELSGTKRGNIRKKIINELETNIENKNIGDLCTGINEFKNCYQPTTNIVKDENGDLLVDFHNIWNSWKNYFCQLLNVCGGERFVILS